MTFRRKQFKWTTDRGWYQISLWREITFPWKTTPNKVSCFHCHWTVKKILPLGHISAQGLTALLRRTWNYSRYLAEQQVTAHSDHRHGRPCPHELENGALKSPQSFTASSSSPSEQHLPSPSFRTPFPCKEHSLTLISARDAMAHATVDRSPAVLIYSLLANGSLQTAKNETKKLTKTTEPPRKAHVMSKNNRTGQIYWEIEKSALNHNSLQSHLCSFKIQADCKTDLTTSDYQTTRYILMVDSKIYKSCLFWQCHDKSGEENAYPKRGIPTTDWTSLRWTKI